MEIQHFGDVVAWFGGMRVINGNTMLDRMRLTLKNECVCLVEAFIERNSQDVVLNEFHSGGSTAM